ncbi:MAG: ABC transporter permease [Actinomycetota bacterium]|nr:ABC transporter permease [Actinomycetota bacterium]
MSAPAATAPTRPAPAGRARLSKGTRLGVAFVGIVALLSLVRILSGADDLTSVGAVAAALGLSVPIGMAALGGLWSERAGVVNIGLEGMMIMGTWCAGWAGYQWGPWAGLVAAIVGGAMFGLLHAVATVTFGVDQIISGVAINILGLGVTQYLSSIAFTGVQGGGPTQSPRVSPMPTVSLPLVKTVLEPVADSGVWLISDLANIAIGLTTNVSVITLLAVAAIVGTYYILWRTRFGLRLRSCGENPWAAESLGVRVMRYKYAAVVASGAFAGMGGAYLVIAYAQIYREGQTGGRGYIGLAAMIFGNWRPGGLAMGSGLFGYVDGLQLRQGGTTVHALLLLAAILLLAFAVWSAWRRKRFSAIAGAVSGSLVLAWYLSTSEVPGEVATIAPYVTTLLVLSLASQRLRMPAADGQVYRKGESH